MNNRIFKTFIFVAIFATIQTLLSVSVALAQESEINSDAGLSEDEIDELAPEESGKGEDNKIQNETSEESSPVVENEDSSNSDSSTINSSTTDSPTTDSSGNNSVEARIYEIYKQYQLEPVTDDFWETNFSELREDIYEVQAGDTLWDISKVFFGDGFYWSKLWAVNDKITNPHEISPHSILRFVRGSEDMPPQVIAENDPEKQPMWSGVGAALNNVALLDEGDVIDPIESSRGHTKPIKDPVFLLPGAPKLPPSKVASKPLIRRLPRALNSKPQNSIRFDKVGFSFEGRPKLPESSVMTLNSFVSEGSMETVGEVIENEGENQVVPLFSYTYIQLKEKAELGEKFTIVRQVNEDYFGESLNVVQILGQITITDFIPNKELVYRAMVIQSAAPMRIGDVAIRDPYPKISFDFEGEPRNIKSTVLGGMAISDQKLFTHGSVVYLNKGSSDGLHPNDVLAVAGQRDSRLKNPKIETTPDYLGLVKVVKTSSHVATALVIQTSDEIRVGDETGLTVKKRELKVPFFKNNKVVNQE